MLKVDQVDLVLAVVELLIRRVFQNLTPNDSLGASNELPAAHLDFGATWWSWTKTPWRHLGETPLLSLLAGDSNNNSTSGSPDDVLGPPRATKDAGHLCPFWRTPSSPLSIEHPPFEIEYWICSFKGPVMGGKIIWGGWISIDQGHPQLNSMRRIPHRLPDWKDRAARTQRRLLVAPTAWVSSSVDIRIWAAWSIFLYFLASQNLDALDQTMSQDEPRGGGMGWVFSISHCALPSQVWVIKSGSVTRLETGKLWRHWRELLRAKREACNRCKHILGSGGTGIYGPIVCLSTTLSYSHGYPRIPPTEKTLRACPSSALPLPLSSCQPIPNNARY